MIASMTDLVATLRYCQSSLEGAIAWADRTLLLADGTVTELIEQAQLAAD